MQSKFENHVNKLEEENVCQKKKIEKMKAQIKEGKDREQAAYDKMVTAEKALVEEELAK
jgi:cell division septum initiation protein DivIVA